MIRYLIALISLLLWPATAWACDGYDLAAVQTTAFSYNAADPRASTLELELRAVETGLERRCRNVSVEIEIIGGTARDPDLVTIADRLSTEWIRTQPVRRNGDVWRLRRSARTDLVNGETVSFAFYLIEAGQFLPPGEYQHTLRITVGDRVTTLPLSVTVQPTMRFEGETTEGTQVLDLGDITNGARASSDFFYRTNSAMAITLVSDNRGALQHEAGAAFGRIEYTASISGQTVDLSRAEGDTVEFAFSGTGIQTGRLEVEVPPSPFQYAGRYRDVITMSFIPY